MKIALVGTAYPFRGGLAAYNERLIREFKEQGHDVVIYTFSLQYPNFLFPGKTQYADWDAPADLDIRPVVNSVNPLNWIATGNKIAREQFDVVLFKFWLPFMGPCFGTIARRIKSGSKAKILCILDNVIPHEKRIGDRPFTSYFLKPIDGFVAMSQSVLKDLDQFQVSIPKAFHPHPIFDNFGPAYPKVEAKAKLGLDPNTNYLLFFGFIRDYKGLDWLLQAFASERLNQLPVKLMVAGEFYVDEEKYQQLIKDLKLEDRLELRTDFIPDQEVGLYFSASDIVVQPYKHATQSGVTQIAYHFDKPMIVTDVGGLAEIVPDNKVGYVVPTTIEAIEESIFRFYDEEKEAAFVQGVQEEKARFSWDSMTRTLLGLLGK